MRNHKAIENNEKLLIEAFKLQNEEAYDEALERLETVGSSLISLIEGYTKNTEFYMRVMPIMKQERELISEKDYKDFIHKNEKVLSKNFQKNAYLALLMQELQHQAEVKVKKWTPEDEETLRKMVESHCYFPQVQEKFAEHDTRELRRRYHKMCKKQGWNSQKKDSGSKNSE